MMISTNLGVSLEVKLNAEAASGTEIVVGNARPVAEETVGKLRADMDFAVKVEENALVLCATDKLSYNYLAAYLKQGLFAKNDAGTLTVDSDDNVHYADSSLTEKNYIEYMQAAGQYVAWDELFAYKMYKNADTELPYRIYVPFNYTADKPVPILVNLHGAGSRGNDNQTQLRFIDTMLMQTKMQVDDAIIICPQCPEGQKWVDANWSIGSYSLETTPESNELRAVVELVQQLMQDYPVDESRIYAMGLSMGGYGTWNLLMNHPDLFAAGVPMCGAGDPKQAEILKDIPIWAVHGAMDPTVPVQGSRDMATAIKAVGGEKLIYTELPNHEHDVWNYTYTNLEIFEWLFSQKKG
jgi:predicted peptidase